MTVTDLFGQIAAGLRIALVLLAASSFLAREQPQHVPPHVAQRERVLHRSAWALMAIGVLSYSPLHTAWLLGHSAGLLVSKAGDAIASALACAAFVQLLAARGVARELSAERVRRGMHANFAAIVGIVLVVTALHRG